MRRWILGRGDFYQLYQPRWFGCERDTPWGGKGILGGLDWAGLGLEDSIENTEQETNEEQFYFITNTYIH